MRCAWSVALAVLVVLACPVAADNAEAGLVSVEAEGMAPIIDGDIPQARDEAIEDAKVKAVEQVVGVFIDSETLVANTLLLSSMVRCSSAGYVREARVINERQDPPGMYRVTIEAWVKPEQLKNGVAEELRSNETVVIMLEESIDADPLDPPILTDRLIQELLDRGFQVIDHNHAALLRERDKLMAAAGGDQAAAQEIGLRFLAGVVITGSARARFSQDNEGIISSMATVSVKAIESDTAEIVAAASLRRVKGFALDRYQAGEKALLEAADQVVTEENLIDRLQDYVGRTERKLTIEVSGLVERVDATRFANFLDVTRWVQTPICDSFAPERSVFTCTYAHPTVFLATRLDRRGEFQVTEYSRNRIVVTALPHAR